MNGHSNNTVAQMPPHAMRARAHRAYAAESRQAAEDRLIVGHLPLVRHIVQKVAAHLPGHVDPDDLVSAGTLGLVKAARTYDARAEAEFRTYAYIRIHGAVIDELRGRFFASSTMREQIRAVRRAGETLLARLGRPPDDDELAAEAGIGTEALYRVLEEARRQHFLSIHQLDDDSEEGRSPLAPRDGRAGPVEEAARKEIAERIARAIRDLPRAQRLVMLLYYERDLTMKEIGCVLDVTEARVSQLHAAAVFKLGISLGQRQ